MNGCFTGCACGSQYVSRRLGINAVAAVSFKEDANTRSNALARYLEPLLCRRDARVDVNRSEPRPQLRDVPTLVQEDHVDSKSRGGELTVSVLTAHQAIDQQNGNISLVDDNHYELSFCSPLVKLLSAKQD